MEAKYEQEGFAQVMACFAGCKFVRSFRFDGSFARILQFFDRPSSVPMAAT